MRYRAHDGVTLCAYVLMANHVHGLVEMGAVPLARTMQPLQFTSSQYSNRRYGTTGQVFQGRYKAILCERESYLRELVRSLPLNPARVRTPLSPWQYPWSSHRAYLGEGGPVAVATAPVLAHVHRQLGPARQAYRRLVKDGLAQGHEVKFYDTVDQRILGDERFVQELTQRTASRPKISSRPFRSSFGNLLPAVAQLYGLTPAARVAPGRQRAVVPARAMLVYAAREGGRLTTQELGNRLHRDPSMISRLYATYRARPDAPREAALQRALAR